MTHNYERAHWAKEGLYSLVTGFLFGATNTIVGHPFDMVKTRMQTASQIQYQYQSSHRVGYFETVAKIYAKEGPLAFYKGCVPPFFGSVIYRSIQFSVFEAFYTMWDHNENMKTPIPLTGGLQVRTLAAGILAGSARAFVECPFEYAKVKRQTNQTWHFRQAYKGFAMLYPRTTGLMTIYFVIVDTCRRKTNAFQSKIGQFLVSGGAASMGFIIIWPFEVLKNQMQACNAQTSHPYMHRFKQIVSEQGIAGLYRGVIPGIKSVFLRNGAAMIVMQIAQRKFTEWGLRN